MYMSFRLVSKSVTLNGVMVLFCVISANLVAFGAHCVKVHVHCLISWWVLVTIGISSKLFSGMYTPYQKAPQIQCDVSRTRVHARLHNANSLNGHGLMVSSGHAHMLFNKITGSWATELHVTPIRRIGIPKTKRSSTNIFSVSISECRLKLMILRSGPSMLF